ncbi:MAG: hypothetical protein HY260_17550 [Chloroflexi bacterium]|nr:hypothetical protein [Chloroflexota bacterium]
MTAPPSVPRLKAPRPLLQRAAVYYPDSDGEPMAENGQHYLCITDTRFTLEQHLKNLPRVYVGADLLIYYVEGDPAKSAAPDVFVTLGVPRGCAKEFPRVGGGESAGGHLRVCIRKHMARRIGIDE